MLSVEDLEEEGFVVRAVSLVTQYEARQEQMLTRHTLQRTKVGRTTRDPITVTTEGLPVPSRMPYLAPGEIRVPFNTTPPPPTPGAYCTC